MKKFASLPLLCILTLGALTLTGCGEIKRGEYAKGPGTIYCDDGFKNILEEEIDVFEYQYPESAIIPKYVSESEAMEALINDSTQTVIVSQDLTKDQREYIKTTHKRIARSNCIAVDAVALIVNKDNPLKDISMEEIGKILKGDIRYWSQLAAGDSTKIKLVFDNQGSSTVSYMKDKFLDGKNITDNPNVQAFAQKNNQDVFNYILKDKYAIGIISVSWLGDTLQNAKHVPIEDKVKKAEDMNETVAKELTSEVTVLGVSNPTQENDFTLTPYKPYQAYIATGEYPLFRKIYMITTASGSTVMKSFYDFVTGTIGQKIMANTGILPYHMNPRIIELK